jgi:hypothetical protein
MPSLAFSLPDSAADAAIGSDAAAPNPTADCRNARRFEFADFI